MSLFKNLRSLLTAGKGIVIGLNDAEPGAEPISLFESWFAAARKSGLFLPEAMTLSTATSEGKPSSRMVLLKSVSPAGFTFFTNYDSRKASDLDSNPHAALLFHWPILQRQIRIEGHIERVSREESREYFHSRPRGSQIGAWASKQSSRLDDRNELQNRASEFKEKFSGEKIPLPDHWGGYRVIPERMEFWQGRPFRLHDRLVFEREDSEWTTHRLYP